MIPGFVGLTLLGVVMVDVFLTTLTTRGSGLVTRWLSSAAALSIKLISQPLSTRAPLVMVGPVVIVMLGLVWILTIWLGWWLIFRGFHLPVVASSSGATADAGELAYFVGFTLSTLGVGDFHPQSTTARILTSIAAFNGLVLVTLFITYVIPVVGAAIARRRVAFSIALLGSTPAAMFQQARSDSGRRLFVTTLSRIESDLIHSAEQRRAYPVVDYFFSEKPEFSLRLQIVRLDELLTLLRIESLEASQSGGPAWARARAILTHYLDGSLPRTSATSTRPPELAPMEDSVGAKRYLASISERRSSLVRLVDSGAWTWNDVHAQSIHRLS